MLKILLRGNILKKEMSAEHFFWVFVVREHRIWSSKASLLGFTSSISVVIRDAFLSLCHWLELNEIVINNLRRLDADAANYIWKWCQEWWEFQTELLLICCIRLRYNNSQTSEYFMPSSPPSLHVDVWDASMSSPSSSSTSSSPSSSSSAASSSPSSSLLQTTYLCLKHFGQILVGFLPITSLEKQVLVMWVMATTPTTTALTTTTLKFLNIIIIILILLLLLIIKIIIIITTTIIIIIIAVDDNVKVIIIIYSDDNHRHNIVAPRMLKEDLLQLYWCSKNNFSISFISISSSPHQHLIQVNGGWNDELDADHILLPNGCKNNL